MVAPGDSGPWSGQPGWTGEEEERQGVLRNRGAQAYAPPILIQPPAHGRKTDEGTLGEEQEGPAAGHRTYGRDPRRKRAKIWVPFDTWQDSDGEDLQEPRETGYWASDRGFFLNSIAALRLSCYHLLALQYQQHS